jgi:hypothetical protein
MSTIQHLVDDICTERTLYLDSITNITEAQACWKPSEAVWSITEITEHLFWAEQGALLGMWKTLHAIRNGSMTKTYISVHQNLPIEQIIELTWQPKEKVPAVAAPRLGGVLCFWASSLHSLQQILVAFCEDLQEDELRLQAHPHPISGALDFQQRLEFLRFHLHRHRLQAACRIEEMV